MEVGTKVYCVDEAAYSEHISKGRKYVIEECIFEKIRIKNNQNKLVWLPEICFTSNEVFEIISIKIDDRIDNPKNDCIEVTIEFSNSVKYWTTFVTPSYLRELLQANRYLILSNFIIVEEINEEIISEIVIELDKKNELKGVTQKWI